MERLVLESSIGEGRFGSVRAAIVKDSGAPVAVKLINLPSTDEGIPHPLARELLIAQRLSHPFIIQTYEVFASGSSIALVMERCKTDLASLLEGRDASNPLSPVRAKSFFRMLLTALAYMHHEGILHRDVKPSNCFISENDELRLGDFGLSRFCDTEISMTHEVVSRWYRAPELLFGKRHYGSEIDMWSAGCVFAELLRGYSGALFEEDGDIRQLSKIFDILGTPNVTLWPSVVALPDWGKVSFDPRAPVPLCEIFPEASSAALDLIQGFLSLDPSRRTTAADALRHPYFTEYPTSYI